MQLFGHPFSSYCQKALIALYENGTAFDFRMLSPDEPATAAEFAAHWPIRRFPLLVDDGRTIAEATTIIEYLDVHHAGAVRFIPADAGTAVDVRMMDRVFDNYVSTPVQKIVGDVLRPPQARDGHGVAEARAMLATAYTWLDQLLADRQWATRSGFTLADCAAAPALFYADWAHPIDASLTHLLGYRARLLARPSIARAVDEARPYRQYFPLGAPDRD